MNKTTFFSGLTLFFILLAASCTRYKDIVYLQDETQTESDGFYPYQVPAYKIQKRDILYIRILSMNSEVTDVINATPTYTANLFNNDASFYIYGYNVNDSGFVEIPVIGKVKVIDKTLEEAKEEIINSTLKVLKEPTVIVKLISFKYSVLGEVTRPGSYVNYNNQLTVLEAISQAGDISAFGNRKKVMVIRPTVDGTRIFRIDLTKNNLLTTEGFFLLPNDIVYVEPYKSKNFRNNMPIISTVFSAITTFLLIMDYVGKQ